MKLARPFIAVLAVVVAAIAPAHAQTGGTNPLPHVVDIHTEPRVPCERTPTSLILVGEFPNGCGTVVDSSMSGSGGLTVTIKVAAGPDTACSMAIKPWRVQFPLGLLHAGHYRYLITLIVIDRDPGGAGFVRHTYQSVHEFDVSATCDPTSGPLPYVKYIRIGPKPGPWNTCPPAICEGESIRVYVGGEFPNNCFKLRKIELLPSPIVGPAPEPDIVRLIVDDGGCLDQVCTQAPVPWSGSVTLPSLPARDYHLIVELARVTCRDTYPPGDLFRTEAPFRIQDCPPLPRCFVAGFGPPGNATVCNATISADEPAVLTFRMASSVGLAALQGEFRLEPHGLAITKLEAIGAAQGWLLKWSPTATGANFVLFAGIRAATSPAAGDELPGQDMLRVTLEATGPGPIPDRTLVRAEKLLGSDKVGEAVEPCPPVVCPTLYPAPPRLEPIAAVCARQECDFNGDGAEDVRDLVRMVRCLRAEGPCPPDVDTRFDCDGDQVFALPDVICCARHILQRPPCPDCPPNGAPRPEPNVRVTFGAPVASGAGVSLPLRIHGADRLGAAMLTFAAPLDRYDLEGVDGPAGNGWITLHEEREGRLVLGILSGGGGRGEVVDLNLRLALRPGETPGGEVAAIGGEFSGSDGEMLAVNLGAPAGALPGPPRLTLSSSRPNPFSTETRFTIELAEPARVGVGVYDLRGRLVAKLFNGALPSGPHELRWDGRGDDGRRAANGVYFYRVEANGKTIARKLIVMRED